jgi:hypothetical protein
MLLLSGAATDLYNSLLSDDDMSLFPLPLPPAARPEMPLLPLKMFRSCSAPFD